MNGEVLVLIFPNIFAKSLRKCNLIMDKQMPFNYDLTRRTKPILNLQGIHSMHFQYIQYSLQWSVSLLQKRSTLRVTAILRRGDRRGKHWVGQRWKRNTIVVLWQL